MPEITSDAEQAKQLGGMIALMPRIEDARYFATGGEPAEDLHLTLFFFSSDVSELAPPVELITALDAELGMFPCIHARLFAHALFNPDGDEPCAVMLAGDSPLLEQLKHDIIDTSVSIFGPQDPDMLQQHSPWVPHVTIGYGMEMDELPSPGEIVFDRVVLTWAGETFTFPLIDTSE